MNYRVRKVDAGGDMSTVLGTAYGDAGDGGAGTSAAIGTVSGLAYNPGNGSLYVADSDIGRIREFTANGNVYTFSGSTPSYGGDDGPYDDASVHYSSLGQLYFDFWGTTDGSLGSLYVADAGNRRVREIALDTNYIQTAAGDGSLPRHGGDGTETGSQLDCPGALALDSDGMLYIADPCDHYVRTFDASGDEQVTLGGGNGYGQVDTPTGLAVDDDNRVYVSDSSANTVSVFERTNPFNATYTVFAGTGAAWIERRRRARDGRRNCGSTERAPRGIGRQPLYRRLRSESCAWSTAAATSPRSPAPVNITVGDGGLAATRPDRLSRWRSRPTASGNVFIAALATTSVDVSDASTTAPATSRPSAETTTLGYLRRHGRSVALRIRVSFGARLRRRRQSLPRGRRPARPSRDPYNGVVRKVDGPL